MASARGAGTVAGRALMFARVAVRAEPVLVNGAAAMLSRRADGTALAVMAMTVRAGRIAEIDIIADPGRLAGLGY